MFDFKKYKLPIAIALIILNLLPVIGAANGKWAYGSIIYFYWGECAVIGLIAIMPHIRRLVVFTLVFMPVATLASFVAETSMGDTRISLTFWSLYCVSWLGYIELGRSRYWMNIRRRHPVEQFLFYLLFMFAAIIICFAIAATIFDAWYIVPLVPKFTYLTLVIMAVVIPSFAIGLLRIIDMIGQKHFISFLLGTYHRPQELDRIVLFLDMEGSSTMAEKLSPAESLRLIANFIYDASDTFRKHGGDIVNYTGDGLVVIWPLKHADKALNAAEDLRQRFLASRSYYKKQFGIIPNFRIGVHAGKVVIAQIGQEKLFIGLYGDVVNTASRIEQINKKLETQILFSEDFVGGLSHHRLKELEKVGTHEIRGKTEKIPLYALREFT